jgi:tRNA-dependent cyclodipeptide synthase
MTNSAFIGVSLDSALFSREWIRAALDQVLASHSDLLIVLADEILAYNKVGQLNGAFARIDIESARSKITQRRHDIGRFIEKELALLPKLERQRVHVATWSDYSDSHYADLLRKLRIAYCALHDFRLCVDADASAHAERCSSNLDNRNANHELCVAYVLDETAMDIRITELADHPFEYYPEQHIQTLTSLYSSCFREFGLTVSELIGRPAQRVFRPLCLESGFQAVNAHRPGGPAFLE